MNRELTLFQEITCTIDSVSVDLHIMCPRCRTKTTSVERLVTCLNTSCGATFKSKTTSIRADLNATEIGKSFFEAFLICTLKCN